ncbi:LuxR C-terminal-related transcriptional regulator [Curtobacterium sp. UCD-KPL2560]|uniref:response regulator transcription factor n=1 Tax=Curtobacterium sp. UCD-KPL2560 TaxID=1885315 RepID=UPI000826FB27|nr:LuxR C-terminal-related transcriptional regulator [Curtobacterium sp. UCD-KPL2560]
MSSVLIVDDETLVRSGLSMILDADPRIDVVGAVSGADALEAVETARPDVVLLDIRMPDRERDVLRLVAEGATNGEIADAVGVSLGTVKDDVGTVLVKLGVRSRVLAALTAARAGLVDR